MPDSTIPAPLAADPIDRLALGAMDARTTEGTAAVPGTLAQACSAYACMAEE